MLIVLVSVIGVCGDGCDVVCVGDDIDVHSV